MASVVYTKNHLKENTDLNLHLTKTYIYKILIKSIGESWGHNNSICVQDINDVNIIDSQIIVQISGFISGNITSLNNSLKYYGIEGANILSDKCYGSTALFVKIPILQESLSNNQYIKKSNSSNNHNNSTSLKNRAHKNYISNDSSADYSQDFQDDSYASSDSDDEIHSSNNNADTSTFNGLFCILIIIAIVLLYTILFIIFPSSHVITDDNHVLKDDYQ